ncbi:MAG: A24 family peptidase [bacterium]|nr:A24 family peptidase [bacterium]
MFTSILTPIVLVALGLAVGSFANVVIDRVPSHRSLRGRSVCDRCRRELRPWELVPILSALFLRFRCPTCDGPIALRMLLVEGGIAALFLGAWWTFGFSPRAIAVVVALTALVILAVIDLREHVVPDRVSVPAMIAVAVLRLGEVRPHVVIIGMLLGAGFFWVQRVVSRGRWVGDGDTRVGALMGALFSPLHLGIALAASYVVGGLLAGVLLAMRRAQRGTQVPLVPFLLLGSVVTVFWGDVILRWYGW